jgi:hypothetical protein
MSSTSRSSRKPTIIIAKAFAVTETIDGHLATLDLTQAAGISVPADRLYTHLSSISTGAPPLVIAVVTYPTRPAKWRAALSAMVDALDASGVSANPDFKAGKDV